MFSIVEKKYKIQVSDVMEKKLRLFGQARVHALMTDFPMIPLRESNGVALYEYAEENMYTMKGVVTIPTITALDVMDLLQMSTTDGFRYTMHEIFGALMLDGMVLHSAAPAKLHPNESLSINWLALQSTSTDLPNRDYVFLKYSQSVKTKPQKAHHHPLPPTAQKDDNLFVSVWESLELDACPPLPESLDVNRMNFRRCGFIVQKFPLRNIVRVSFILSESHPVKTGVSHLTQNWLSRLLVSLSELPNVLISHFLSRQVLLTDIPDDSNIGTCMACPAALSKQKKHCGVCGKSFCPSCVSLRNVQQQGRSLQIRVCTRCATLKYRNQPTASQALMFRAHSSPELIHNNDPLRDKMKKLAMSLVKTKGWRELGTSCAAKLLALREVDMKLVREVEQVQFYEISFDNVFTTKAVFRIPRMNIYEVLRQIETPDCNSFNRSMGILFGTIFMESQVLHSTSATPGDTDAWSINYMSLDGDESLFLKYGTILYPNDGTGSPVGVSVWESLPVREYQDTMRLMLHRCGFLIEECPTTTALRVSFYLSQLDHPQKRARSLLTRMSLVVSIPALLKEKLSDVSPCRHCRHISLPKEVNEKLIVEPPRKRLSSPLAMRLHDQVIERLHSFLYELDAPMTLVKESKEIQLYELNGPNRFTIKAVLHLPRLVHIHDVLASLEWTNTAAMTFSLRHLFGHHFISGAVVTNSNIIQLHHLVLQNTKPRLPSFDYLFASHLHMASPSLGVVLWESVEVDGLCPPSSDNRRRTFHHCGLVVEEIGGSFKISVILSDVEPRTRPYLHQLLSEMSPASFSAVVLSHSLAHVPLSPPKVDGLVCGLCNMPFTLVRPKFFCGICCIPMCLPCGVVQPLQQSPNAPVPLCRLCSQPHTTHLHRLNAVLADSRFLPLSSIENFEAIGKQSAIELMTPLEHMEQLRDVQGVQFYQHENDDLYTMQSVVLIPKCKRHVIIDMLAMPTSQLLCHFMRELFGNVFTDGQVLYTRNTMSLDWMLLRHKTITAEYVYLKYQHHDSKVSASVWKSIDLDRLPQRPDVARLRFHRAGFVVEDKMGGDNANVCRITFTLSEKLPNGTSISPKAKMWMQKMLSCIAGMGKALIGYQLSTRCLVMTPRESAATTCNICTKTFSIVRTRTYCRVCGAVVCNRCADIKTLLQKKDVKVCHHCVSRALSPDNAKTTGILEIEASSASRGRPDVNQLNTNPTTTISSHGSNSSSNGGADNIVMAASSMVRLSPEQTTHLRLRGPVWRNELLTESNRNMQLVRDPSKGAQMFERQDSTAYVVKSVLILPKYNLVDVMALLEMPSLEIFRQTMRDLFGNLFVDGSLLYADPPNQYDSLSLTWMVFHNSRTHLPLRDSIVLKYGAIQQQGDGGRRVGVITWESIPIDAAPPLPPLANMVRVVVTRSGFVVEELDQALRVTFLLTEVHTGRRTVSNYMKLWMHKIAGGITEIPKAMVARYLSQLTLLTHFSSSVGSVCVLCSHSFSSLRRRFNCCVCGDEVCSKCSDAKRVRQKEVHVCLLCTAPSKLLLRRRNSTQNADDDSLSIIESVS